MNPDESIPTDASTVFRNDNSASATDATHDSPLQDVPPHLLQDGEYTDGMDIAKTVIREGSAEGDSSPSRRAAEALNRTPASITRILLGKQLNHFSLEELIGGGGMGAVFRAHDEQLDREVAIKVVPFAGDDADLQRRFRNEAQSAAKLDHPRIARVFDVGNQDDWYYIVFEYVKGTNIRDLVNRSDVLAIDDAVYYTCQVAEALQHASDRGIVHRDVKPSNVLIDSDREVKLVDMGLARSDKMDMSHEDLTASGVTLGTFDYISPEQAKDPRAADLRSDIYSLGCTLYFMLTGQPPYPGGTMLQKLLNHGNSPPPDARHYRNGVSYELAAVIQKMLAKDPGQRYQTATELVSDLREVAFREGLMRSQGVAFTAVSAANPVVSWLEHNSPWLVPSTLLLLGAAWLQFSSAVSRKEFNIAPPQAAELASAIAAPDRTNSLPSPSPNDPNVVLENGSRANLTNAAPRVAAPVNAGAIAPDSMLATETLGGASARSPRPEDPPSLTNLPVPSELETPTRAMSGAAADLASADSVPNDSPTNDRDALMPSANVDFSSDDPAFQSPTVVEFPRLIRLVSAESAVDSLGDPIERDLDGAAITSSLAKALDLADQYDVSRIELATAVIYSEPVTIRRDGLTIASAIGGSSIVFKTPSSLASNPAQMIDLGSNKTEFDDIHFVWDVPVSQTADSALIRMSSNRLVRLTDCSITIGNAAGTSEVCAFGVSAKIDDEPAIVNEDATADESLPLVGIQMYNVIVRGQISMIKLDDAAALQLQWENGLLAISGCMIEMPGAMNKPSMTSSAIQISLRQLTSHTPNGLLKMTLQPNKPYPVMIDRDVSNCVFVVDKGKSHVQISGLASIDDEIEFLKTRGEANAYEVDRVMLSLDDLLGNSKQVSIRDLAAQSPPWWDERSTRWTIWWKQHFTDDSDNPFAEPQELSDVPPDQRTEVNYRQDGAVFGGFDENSLPQLPFESDNSGLDIPLSGVQTSGKL
ncbi:serine/threonine protein kinase [Planctomycetes bacterium K23_9]|uniref:non-specific serine/threonine protein kinase n=1 Tax=Stieleria marina TaxID=1930275 RepID=A0A517NN18_9BACT|nr:Serine/threonine-protein kinase PrkC [Planctomycetes bacterium K23_9]